MHLSDIRSRIPATLYDALAADGIAELRPAQEKAIRAGLLDGRSMLVCTPTASGKTLIAELAMISAILSAKGGAVYIVPLRALASEKYREFSRRYGSIIRVQLAMGDADSAESYLAGADLVVCTAEKLDAVMRHRAAWISRLAVVVTDEIHLLNDPGRGPTLEILLTMLRKLLPGAQFLSLSATIGNPDELAEWLHAALVVDDWRPVRLEKGVFYNAVVDFG